MTLNTLGTDMSDVVKRYACGDAQQRRRVAKPALMRVRIIGMGLIGSFNAPRLRSSGVDVSQLARIRTPESPVTFLAAPR
jgi:hypothetical protein